MCSEGHKYETKGMLVQGDGDITVWGRDADIGLMSDMFTLSWECWELEVCLHVANLLNSTA